MIRVNLHAKILKAIEFNKESIKINFISSQIRAETINLRILVSFTSSKNILL